MYVEKSFDTTMLMLAAIQTTILRYISTSLSTLHMWWDSPRWSENISCNKRFAYIVQHAEYCSQDPSSPGFEPHLKILKA